uniref:Ankyrin repeat-containing protein n=1 Tax=Noccaea caerulescens TaxID=107243 RepID=A0A1J3FGZ4_NOCCA
MDSSEAGLDRIEAQRTTDASRNQLRLSDIFNIPGEYVMMNAKLFGALSDGSEEWLAKLRSLGTPMACLKSHRGDSVLHLVAAWGHLEGVKTIISECAPLLLEPNWKGQLPLHVAAHGGHLAIVEALVASVTFVSGQLCEEEREAQRLNLCVVKDINGDTPLNLALKGHNMEVAFFLVNAYRQASFLANKDGISPLYLAVEAANVSLVTAMLRNDGPQGNMSSLYSQLEGRKYLAHAALELRSTEILDLILKECPSLEDERDEEGRTCLSFGASMGNYEGVCILLDRTSSVFECNDDGSFPIHVAIEKGHIKIVKEILKRCPYSKHLLNTQDQNILHVAANSGKFKILHHLMKHEQTKHMENEQDEDGNTPLHLATIKWRPKATDLLKGRKNVFIKNNSGLTALDIAESNMQPQFIFRERLTLVVLALGYVQRDRIMKLTKPSVHMIREGNKEYINALLLVAALVATVTFAAGFTIPGGFNNLGMATLATDSRLIIFLIFDMVAMQCSVVAVVSLMWAQLGDPALRSTSLNVALKSLHFALESMVLAFLFGMVIAAGNVKWLVVVIYVINLVFLFAMACILSPHITLQEPLHKLIHSRFGRFMLALNLFYFLGFVDDDGDESPHQT